MSNEEGLASRRIYLDFHTHILPEMDDGSDCVETSLEMIRLSRLQGVGCIFLTPHFYATSDYPAHFIEKRSRKFRMLTSKTDPTSPLLIPGAEVQYYEGITAILIEMPFRPWSERMINDILDINSRQGFQVVLAHVERYLPFVGEDLLRMLVREGVLMQANAGFFSGFIKSRKAVHMLKEGLIHFIGSDAHNLSSRAPNLANAYSVIEKKCGSDEVKRLIIRGRELLMASVPDEQAAEEEIPI